MVKIFQIFKNIQKLFQILLKLAKSQKIGMASPLVSNFINTPETGAISVFMQEPTFSLRIQTTL